MHRVRRLFRTGVLVAGWALFAVLWYATVQEVSHRALALTVAVLALALVVNAAAAGLMLLGRHDRAVVPSLSTTPTEDRLGRSLVLDAETKRSQVVHVSLDPESRSKRLLAQRGSHA